MISRRHLLATAAATGASSAALSLSAPTAVAVSDRGGEGEHSGGGGVLRVESTTTEYADRPMGLDTPRPRFSWQLGASAPDQVQHAYQIRVATSPARLADPDVWDSGRRASRQSLLVPFDGPTPQPGTRYHWSVRVWDGAGRPSAWSEPTWWETGLTGSEQWHGDWIAAPAALVAAPSLEGASWIWFPEEAPGGNAPAGTRWFRRSVEIPGGVRRARLVITADNGFTTYVNGTELTHRGALDVQKSWSRPALLDLTHDLRAGTNTLAVSAENIDASPAGLIAVLEITTDAGTTRHTTGDGWLSTDRKPGDGWQEPGADDSGWQPARTVAAWGADPWGKVRAEQSPAQLRRSFSLARKRVASARLYVTALGLYEAHLNGERVGEDRLAPGWTDYKKRVPYQAYDVTDAVRRGDNALGVTLATGWYAGNVGWFGQDTYGAHPALLAQLEVRYTDGSTDRITTDEQWRAAAGPLVTADLMMGEQYDARAETPGWTAPGFDDSGWRAATAQQEITATVVATTEAPTRMMREVEPVKVTEQRPGVFLYDLGQNMVGVVRLTVRGGEAGRKITVRHGEVLDQDGALYVANFRTARPVDTYTLKGAGEESYEPRFTFHGFRYVEVTGYPGTPPKDAVVGRVLHTAVPFTLDFSTDDAMLNQLHSNITWGQRGNFLAVPTDTPARDERLGWSGDINVFAPTAAYTMDSARFLTKWLRDLRDGQSEDGAFPDVAPLVGPVGSGVAGWGDAGVTVPWALYQAYGDEGVLAENWPAMQKWISYLEAHSNGLLRPAEGYGDWLNVDDETPKDVIGTAYFAHATDLVARIAKVLGKDSGPYDTLLTRIRQVFNDAYVSDGTRIKGDTQTAYVLALSMSLLPSAAARRAAAARLVELIEARKEHLSTGFLGTPRLLPALTEAGHADVAHRLLHQRTFPSWGYQIDKGATTMWERWDSIEPDGSFQDVGMNSFNHYAYGCVGEWMYQNLAGITAGEPGFRTVVVRPRPGGGVRTVSARFDGPYGPVRTRWTLDGTGRFTLTVSVPVNTTAEVWVPAARAEDVTHDGTRFLRMAEDRAVFRAGSGTHRFVTS
ncbi:alpha-L-rhamnosidase [Streptomyces sp. NPDC053560]|uniref:alpha-L-rhamnosidase n=1 Tax=Streptomyces sp. NPDC053560 TaxID=3365711 RepID=UPI0037D24881